MIGYRAVVEPHLAGDNVKKSDCDYKRSVTERVIISCHPDLKRTKAEDQSKSFCTGPVSISEPVREGKSPKCVYSSLLKSTICVISICYNS